MKDTRRDFLKKVAMTSAAMAVGCNYDNDHDLEEKSKRLTSNNGDTPNILLVLVDQERQPMHTRPLRTPSRDRLKGHALEFTNAHCTYPLCSPSRATVFTGRYPHEAGILRNCDPMGGNKDMSYSIPTLGSVLSQSGYRTGYFGKWHLSGLTRVRTMPRRYGFDEARLSNQVVGIGSDEYFARYTGNWIKKQKDRGPWFAVYAPLNPHDICYPVLRHFYPFEYADTREDTSLPPNYSSVRSPGIQVVREKTIDWGRFSMGIREDFTDDYFRQYIAFYCNLVEEVDRCFGLILDDIDQSGQWNNTIVVYTSDHGEMAASHGLQNKGTTMYEENLNIPLLISHPGIMKGHTSTDSLVSNIDLVPTILSMTGVQWPEKLHGKSLLSASGTHVPGNRDHVFAEGGGVPVAYWRGIRTREWKYWHYTETGEELLFNIKEDPYELNNLAGDPAHTAKTRRFRNSVRAWRTQTNDPVKSFLT